ncbi:MAG: AAA family ATPase, partial [Victivallales bacterium]|nr:AAA family ATPase [Victivallales bacterium]
LLRLDIGRLMGKYVGESEENLRRAVAVAESASPCILWIDEIEKAFAGIGDAGGGSVTTRMFGYFLTWMQEKKSCIYVVATANDISNLPPEFLRRGRFDEIFQVKFPNKDERKEILEIQIKKRNHGKLPSGIDIGKLASLLRDEQNYSGADIESIVKESMKRVFVANVSSGLDRSQWRSLAQSDLEQVMKETPSSYHSQKAKLDKMLDKLRELDVKSAT